MGIRGVVVTDGGGIGRMKLGETAQQVIDRLAMSQQRVHQLECSDADMSRCDARGGGDDVERLSVPGRVITR